MKNKKTAPAESTPPPFPVVGLPELWTGGDREELVHGLGKRRWRVSDLIHAVRNEPVFDVPLAFLDLASHCFDQEGGLIDFAMHMQKINKCSLEFPIIMDQWGRIIDGRHRIVKALIEGHTTIKAVKVPDGMDSTSRET
jgi:hypothetical protein